ncbi:unnamed protein product, partial [Mesorhabditis belari]|uniref:Uncharacterized protein n=1 Tax=Mesorhabditis belari TaxID=2138241 RepID=A0AAF3EQJ1_9BILA
MASYGQVTENPARAGNNTGIQNAQYGMPQVPMTMGPTFPQQPHSYIGMIPSAPIQQYPQAHISNYYPMNPNYPPNPSQIHPQPNIVNRQGYYINPMMMQVHMQPMQCSIWNATSADDHGADIPSTAAQRYRDDAFNAHSTISASTHVELLSERQAPATREKKPLLICDPKTKVAVDVCNSDVKVKDSKILPATNQTAGAYAEKKKQLQMRDIKNKQKGKPTEATVLEQTTENVTTARARISSAPEPAFVTEEGTTKSTNTPQMVDSLKKRLENMAIAVTDCHEPDVSGATLLDTELDVEKKNEAIVVPPTTPEIKDDGAPMSEAILDVSPVEPFTNLQSILDSLDVRTAATISLSDVTTAHEFNMADLREHTVQKMISTYGIGSVDIRAANCRLGSASESNDDFRPHPSVLLCTQQRLQELLVVVGIDLICPLLMNHSLLHTRALLTPALIRAAKVAYHHLMEFHLSALNARIIFNSRKTIALKTIKQS